MKRDGISLVLQVLKYKVVMVGPIIGGFFFFNSAYSCYSLEGSSDKTLLCGISLSGQTPSLTIYDGALCLVNLRAQLRGGVGRAKTNKREKRRSGDSGQFFGSSAKIWPSQSDFGSHVPHAH